VAGELVALKKQAFDTADAQGDGLFGFHPVADQLPLRPQL